MLRLINPNESHPLTLPFDEGPDATIFWVRPMTQREFALATAAGKASSGADDDSDWAAISKQITKIENVNWGGQRRASFDDRGTIIAILKALPARSASALNRRIGEFCTLTGPHSKNCDGSSALLDTGSPLVVRASDTTVASAPGPSDSGSPASEPAPTS